MLKILLPILLVLTGCVTTPPAPEPTPPSGPNCDMVAEDLLLQYNSGGAKGTYTQTMPVTKPMAHESHYIVPGLDPEGLTTQTDRIKPHLQRTCDQLLRGKWAKYFPGMSADCHEIYRGGGWSEWTPPEPTRGHGSAAYPGVECEAATANMYWTSKSAPAKGTRFLAKNPKNGKVFVLCMGYEAGPGDKAFGGGLGSEAMYYLGAAHGSVLTLARAADQTLPYGPVECGKAK